jgi:hypothetical protein
MQLPLDTSQQAHEVQSEIYRRMTPAERVRLMIEMCEEARAVSAAGIAARHPEYDSAQLRYALLRLILGDALFRKAFPVAPCLTP